MPANSVAQSEKWNELMASLLPDTVDSCQQTGVSSFEERIRRKKLFLEMTEEVKDDSEGEPMRLLI
jgi:hypothetical protein